MHFPIIVIEDVDNLPINWCRDLPIDDKTLQEHTDYYGEIYTPSERKEVIKAKWFTDFFDGFADVDTKKETITFKDKDTCRKHLMDYYKELAEELYDKAQTESIRGYDFYCAAMEYKGYPELFYLAKENYAQTSADFVGDSVYMAGKIYRIGNIFDAHY